MSLRHIVGQFGFLLAVIGAPGALFAAEPDVVPETISFNEHVRPILATNCFACHGPDAEHREADLRFDVFDESLAEGGIIVPGDPAGSQLIERIASDDEYMRMPPPETNKHLTGEEIEILRRWVAEGAVYQRHWAYEPPLRHDLPAVVDASWSDQPIDRFLQARLEAEGLHPSSEADRVTLARRLHFDLIGLPPTATEVDAFVSDDSDQAYEKLVDRLLASPHFGERLAMVWLDLVRFADTVGYHGDQDHNISPYRDYVIKAFNENLPYDQFTVEQLAGDLLPDPTLWQQVATGYNRLLQTSHEGGVQAKEYLAKYLADRVRNASEVWLGATLGCAECHDHKYDPFTQTDFYAFGAFFADIDEAEHLSKGTNDLPTRRAPEIRAWNLPQYAALRKIDAELEQLNQASGKGDSAAADARAKELQTRRQAIEEAFRLTMVTQAIEPREIRVLPRGNWLDESGPIVQPAIPGFLGTLSADSRATRLDLAHWLTSRDNPLTARVWVNRLWAVYFGGGLCRSLDDFGLQGVAPDHPQLLDWLAVDFMEHDWDVKRLVKQIVMSRAYRQLSLVSAELAQHDPENRLFARQGRFRLPAELVRDNALALSGLLNDEIGGHSVRPYQPVGYYQHLNFPERTYHPDLDPRQYRRGVYVHWQRSFLHPMLKAFDAPTREECTAQRSRSNTPLAALVSLNDPTFVEAARALALRIMHDATGDAESRVRWAWQQALGRQPDAAEVDVLSQLYAADLAEYRATPTSADKLTQVGMYAVPAGADAAELAAWTGVARALLNLNETMTRN